MAVPPSICEMDAVGDEHGDSAAATTALHAALARAPATRAPFVAPDDRRYGVRTAHMLAHLRPGAAPAPWYRSAGAF